MKKIIKITKKLVLALSILFLLGSCFNMDSSGSSGGEGILKVVLPGSPSYNSVGLYKSIPADSVLSTLEYRFVLTGNGTETFTLSNGTTQGTVSLAQGKWTINVEAYSDNILVGKGNTEAEVVSGKTTNAIIEMIFTNTGIGDITAVGSDNNTYQVHALSNSTYTVIGLPSGVADVTISATAKVEGAEITYNPPDGTVSSFPGDVEITIKAGDGFSNTYTVIVDRAVDAVVPVITTNLSTTAVNYNQNALHY